LERETRKLEEIAVSDTVLNAVTAQISGTTVQQLRDQKLQLSQPGNGGWHFFADDRDPQRAGALASAWALPLYKMSRRKSQIPRADWNNI